MVIPLRQIVESPGQCVSILCKYALIVFVIKPFRAKIPARYEKAA